MAHVPLISSTGNEVRVKGLGEGMGCKGRYMGHNGKGMGHKGRYIGHYDKGMDMVATLPIA